MALQLRAPSFLFRNNGLASVLPTILKLMVLSAFIVTDPTITSGSPVIRVDQRLLWRFGKLRAARVSALQTPVVASRQHCVDLTHGA
jgi:hypothetical protein